MSANPTQLETDYPSVESATTNVIFILNKTKFLLIIFFMFLSIKKDALKCTKLEK